MAVSVKLDDALKGRLQQLATAQKRSPHWIMREAIARYVDEGEAWELTKRAAVTSWETYQQSGLHVTFEEADSWLAELETGMSALPPKCHQ